MSKDDKMDDEDDKDTKDGREKFFSSYSLEQMSGIMELYDMIRKSSFKIIKEKDFDEECKKVYEDAKDHDERVMDYIIVAGAMFLQLGKELEIYLKNYENDGYRIVG